MPSSNMKKKLGLEHNSTTAHRYWRALIIEFIATGLFVFCAAGSVVAQQIYEISTASSNLVAGIVQGFAIAALVYTAAPTSGGHINPAVTFALMVSGDMPLLDGLGGIVGAALLSGVLPGHVEGTLGTTTLSNGTSRFQGYIFELIVTFLLLFTIFGSSVDKDNGNAIKSLAPIPIGFSVMAGVAIAFGFTGGSLNPARTLGPAVISHTWDSHYIYWLGPLTAALLAGALHRFMLKTKPSKAAEDREKREDANNDPKEKKKAEQRDIEEGEREGETSR